MDILSTLNTGGSGLNIRELSETLAQAEVVPRKELVQARIDSAETRLSGYDRLRGTLDSLDGALDMMRGLTPRRPSSDSAAVGITLDDPAALDMRPTELEVDRLARAQVLNFGGYAGPDEVVGSGSLTIDRGTWSDSAPPVFTPGTGPARSLSFGAGSTLADIAAGLNTVEGVTARIIDMGDGSFSLGVISETGVENALRFSTAPGSDLAALDFSADPTQVQAQAAQDAALRMDGIAVTRPTNSIDDLLPGVTLDLRSVTTQPAGLRVSEDEDGTLTALQGLVDALNATRSAVTALTARGLGGTNAEGETGDLAGDSLAREALAGINRILGRGFGAENLHLADIGIRTERDGSLSFDAAAFSEAFQDNPAMLDPLLRSGLTSDTARLEGTPPSGTGAGSFTLTRDPATGDANLGGQPLFGTAQPNGDWSYRALSGPMRGVEITVPASARTAQIDFAPSLLDSLQDHLDDVMATGGTLETRTRSLESEIMTEEAALSALDERQEAVRLRQLNRLTEMERVVTQLNSTADYLTNMVDSWNSDS